MAGAVPGSVWPQGAAADVPALWGGVDRAGQAQERRPDGRVGRAGRFRPAASFRVVRYLGQIAGAGSVRIGGETVARAAYDFDGFATRHGGVTASGELRLAPSDLEAVFGKPGVQLLTDDGRLLDLKFSETALPPASTAAHVDVSGELPRSPAEWRAGSTREPTHPTPDPGAASKMTQEG